MSATLSKAKIESEIAGRFGDAFRLHEKVPVLTLSTGIPAMDALIEGLPRGAITEIFGPVSSGRTSVLFSLLAYATTHDEICALVDVNNVFAPTAASASGIDFERLLWVRCAASLENAFKAVDLLLHAGGFGLVTLDMGDVPAKDARRIISSWWYRFRRTVENKPTAIVVISEETCTRSCAALTLELNGTAEWTRPNNFQGPEVQLCGSQKRNVLPMRNQVHVTPQWVTHGNLLHNNSINIKRQRPITSGLNESRFSAEFYEALSAT